MAYMLTGRTAYNEPSPKKTLKDELSPARVVRETHADRVPEDLGYNESVFKSCAPKTKQFFPLFLSDDVFVICDCP